MPCQISLFVGNDYEWNINMSGLDGQCGTIPKLNFLQFLNCVENQHLRAFKVFSLSNFVIRALNEQKWYFYLKRSMYGKN